ncbi:MAG: short-chain dehydrogenase [Gammaproteobacteria bacterium]|nr:short-chain dehydrogenase [Gammaproteobacteria bacterium]
MPVALITGASKGIGLATAKQLLQSGWRVVNFSRSPSPAVGVENHAIDLSAADAETRVGQIIGEILPRSDQQQIALIHNAAKLQNDTADNLTAASFENIIRINVLGPHILNQAIIPRMRDGSSILYIGSTLSEKAVPNSYSYVTTKHAMVGQMRATCQDLAGSGIHTACICPGFTDTEMLREHVDHSNEVLESVSGMSAFGRLIAPEEIAATITFAADNPVLNGSVIHANLGQVER